jgi:hypothetical protein
MLWTVEKELTKRLMRERQSPRHCIAFVMAEGVATTIATNNDDYHDPGDATGDEARLGLCPIESVIA